MLVTTTVVTVHEGRTEGTRATIFDGIQCPQLVLSELLAIFGNECRLTRLDQFGEFHRGCPPECLRNAAESWSII